MDILLFCPSGLVTGGTEGIHNLARALNRVGANAKILYIGQNPEKIPKELADYGCEYLTEYPTGYKGAIIFPEVWGNQVTDPKYKDNIVAINWQGVDVYDWQTPLEVRKKYLERKNTIHIANSEYAVDHLKRQRLSPVKISDCLNDDFYDLTWELDNRKDTVLYNPVRIKHIKLQDIVMSRCTTELGIRFRPVVELTRSEVIDLFKHSKLYIDFGYFSGRERLPREAVMCGCCIVTNSMGTAGYFKDNSILDMYRADEVVPAIQAINYVLRHYMECKSDFDLYRDLLKRDKMKYLDEVRGLYNAFLNHNSCI